MNHSHSETKRARLNVLVIDDDEVDRLMVKRCLIDDGRPGEFLEAATVKEAAEISRQNEVDVVLLDLGLGSTEGLDTLKDCLRKIPGVPTVVVSGMDDDQTAFHAINQGAQDFLRKDGLQKRWLGIALRNAVQRYQMRQSIVQFTSEVERVNADLQQFAHIVSHDLQEPLRAQIGYSELLLKRSTSKLDEKDVGYLQKIFDSAQRMKKMTEDLLAYSEAVAAPHTFSDVALDQSVAEALLRIEEIADKNGATVRFDKLPVVKGNLSQLSQLFQNLISNAIKYRTDAAPEVLIEASIEDGSHVISVMDNGIGIEPKYQDTVFDIFKRLHTQAEFPGTGIGLAICKRIVERHNGSISVTSRDGGGSCFIIRLCQKSDIRPAN